MWGLDGIGWDAPVSVVSASARRSAREGLVLMAPLALGVGPFGLVVGASASQNGLSVAESVGFSVFVFAGASQLAAVDLLGNGAGLAVVIGTALVINMRMLMYSASLAPYAGEIRPARRTLMTYLLVDQAYALSIVRWERKPEAPADRFAFFAGVAVPLWAVWQVTTVLGMVFGSQVPDGIPLTFTVTLVFLAVLVPAVTDRPRLVAAVVAGGVAVTARGLPANLALPVGALCGIAAGAWFDARSRR